MSRLPFKPRAGARAAARPVIPKPAADEFAEEAEPSAPPPAGYATCRVVPLDFRPALALACMCGVFSRGIS